MSLVERIEKVLEQVRKDNRSGAVSLQKKLEDGLLAALKEIPELRAGEEKEIILMLQQFGEDMAPFAVVRHFVDHLITFLQKTGKTSKKGFMGSILQYKNEWDHVNERIYRNFLRCFPGVLEWKDMVIFLHSQSSTILEFLRLLRRDNPSGVYHLCQTESRPMLEGQQQALLLRGMGYSVVYMTDAAIADPLSEADLVLLGADTVFPSFFMNKQGTYPITLLAREMEVPCYVLADSRKFVAWDEEDEDVLWEEPQHPAGEVWGGEVPEGISVLNKYFEDVPTDIVTAFVTEKHVIPGEELDASDIFL